jgi:hypothetical protein
MYFFKLIIFVFCLHATSVFAAAIDCEISDSYADWSGLHIPFEVKPSGLTMTLGDNIADWQILYTAYVNIGMLTSSCSSSTSYGGSSIYYTFLSQSTLIGTQGMYHIYNTDIPGIGISVTVDGNSANIQPYPEVVYYGAPNLGTGFWVKIVYWKIPGEIPMANGPITVTGPDAALVLMSAGSNYTASDPSRITSDGLAYISSSRILKLTMMFQPGTCNIEGDNIKVNMGEYNGADGHSDWKDASFKLKCPDGLGYGGIADTEKNSNDGYNFPTSIPTDAKITANSIKNGKVKINIVPYTQVIDANKGIISLDGTGAQGYGIQLAWGDYSSQSAVEPKNPVILNSYVDANSLNSGFGAGDTPIGGNAFSGTDNTIKMAARYIRTTGETAPGPANAVVQVIANYQ